MSGLFGSLQTGVKALNAQSRAIETAGRNLANVNNAHYARQRVEFGDRGTVVTAIGPMSLGLEALGIQQLRNALLDKQYTQEVSRRAELERSQAGLEMAQAGLGQYVDRTSNTGSSSDGAHGIAETMADFFNSFYSLSAKPTDVGEKQTLVQRAGILVDRFNLTDTRLAQVQADMSAQVAADVEKANGLLDAIANLNREIARFELNSPGGAADLRDKRQQKLEELGELMSFETRAQPGASTAGQIQVYTKDSLGNEIVLVDLGISAKLATDAGATQITTTQIVGASAGSAAVLSVSSGSIKGAMDVRDGSIQTLRDNLDNLAAQLVASVNGVYSASGKNFFLSSGTTAGTIKLDPSLTYATLQSGTGAAGDNSFAQAIANLANQSFSTAGGDHIDGTFTQYYNETVSELGQTLEGVSSRLSDQETIEELVKSQRDAVSGVSLDEEMADLMKYQRAFQASSRVISVIDALLDNVVNQLGRA